MFKRAETIRTLSQVGEALCNAAEQKGNGGKRIRDNPEQQIKNAILDYLALLKGCVYWVTDSVGIWDPVKKIYRKRNSKHHRPGVSDIIACYRGSLVAIEVKSRRGRLTDEQRLFLNQVAAAGGISIVARSVDDVMRVVA